MKFRGKPVVIEAEQFLGPDCVRHDEENPASPAGVVWRFYDAGHRYPVIRTLDDDVRIRHGDWIITIEGKKHPCHPDIFAATYEAEEPTTLEPGVACREVERAP